jgi:MinD-like ATPase involved in chromosome partitioning or flagellar assembly
MVPKLMMYSFKGGAGRTVTTANVAYILASELGRRVLLIDMDVESAGTSLVFDLDASVREGACRSIQDILRGYTEVVGRDGETRQEKIGLHPNTFEQVTWPQITREIPIQGNGYLKVIPGQVILRGKDDTNSFDVGKSNFDRLCLRLDGMVENAPQIVLWDSSSGQQETASMGLDCCQVLVVFVRWSRQFIIGTTRLLQEHVKARNTKIKRVFIVPTAVPRQKPGGALGEQLERRERQFRDDISLINDAARKNFGARDGWVELLPAIYECDALKWDERVFLLSPDAKSDPGVELALSDYRALAQRLSEACASRTDES